MASLNAQLVAKKVSETIRKNEKVVLGEIIRNSGYSIETSLKPKLVTGTKSYKGAIRPVVDGIEVEIHRIMDAVNQKDHDKEEFRVLVYSLDILIKNYQLLSGGVTERQVLVLPSELIAKNNIRESIE